MQKIHVAMIVTMFLSAPPHGRTQTTADSLSIAKTALNYIEGWYEGNAERMKQSLHPKLAKRRVFVDHETGKTKTQHLSAWHMIMGTRFGGGKATVREDRKNEIIILDIIENNASVKAVSADFIDYLHLARYDGQWRIVNVLWELRQEINQEAGSAVLLLILIVIIVLSPVLVWPIGFFIRSFRSGKATSFIRSLPPKYPTIARCLILLGEDADKLASAMHDTVPIYLAQDMREAVQLASEHALPGDAVLLSPACASFDMFDGYAHRGRVFSELAREVCQ